MSIRQWSKWLLGITFLPVIILCVIIAFISFKDYSKYYQERRGVLSEVSSVKDTTGHKYWITLKNSDGFVVDCGLLLPRSREKRCPAIILLGGKATGKYAIDYALDIDDVLILALDYPYQPRENYNFFTIVQDIPTVRQVLLDMVPATMLALDYLYQRADVDSTKIILVGYSFGAEFVPVIAATDRRIQAAIMVYGGGDLHSLIQHNVHRFKGPVLSEFVGLLGGCMLRPLEPMRYVDKISPIPLVMINGTNDEQVPFENTKIFYNAAREPKKLVWLNSHHVTVSNVDLTRTIIVTLKEEMKRLNILDDPAK